MYSCYTLSEYTALHCIASAQQVLLRGGGGGASGEINQPSLSMDLPRQAVMMGTTRS